MSRVPSYAGFRPSSPAASAAARGASKKRDTKPELVLRRALWRRGHRFRVARGDLPGRPDIAFPGRRLAIFCDGDFWHGRAWPTRREKLARGSNATYWIPKIERNIARDEATTRELRERGWTVLRFWESEIVRDVGGVVEAVERALSSTAMGDLPPIQAYMDPVLKALSDAGGEADNETINSTVARQLGLTEAQLAVAHGRGDNRTEFEYRIAWARTKLKGAGKISSAGRGRWRLCNTADT